jgi:hypothetical protein
VTAIDLDVPPRRRGDILATALGDRRIPGLLAVALLWALIVMFSLPGRVPFQTGLEALAYWSASLADPYARSVWTTPGAYVYSPAVLQLIAPLTALAWPIFVATWTGILLLATRVLSGPRWFVPAVALVSIELLGGNVSLLLAVAIVAGFRWPAAWAFVLLTKITPGVGLLWFVVRGEWRAVGIALGATGLIAAASAVVMPGAWVDWFGVLTSSAGKGGTWAAVPVPFVVRLPIAVALVTWGARTDRPWTVPVASMLALPALWYGSLSMLLAVLPLVSPDRSRGAGAQRPDGVRVRALLRPR